MWLSNKGGHFWLVDDIFYSQKNNVSLTVGTEKNSNPLSHLTLIHIASSIFLWPKIIEKKLKANNNFQLFFFIQSFLSCVHFSFSPSLFHFDTIFASPFSLEHPYHFLSSSTYFLHKFPPNSTSTTPFHHLTMKTTSSFHQLSDGGCTICRLSFTWQQIHPHKFVIQHIHPCKFHDYGGNENTFFIGSVLIHGWRHIQLIFFSIPESTLNTLFSWWKFMHQYQPSWT